MECFDNFCEFRTAFPIFHGWVVSLSQQKHLVEQVASSLKEIHIIHDQNLGDDAAALSFKLDKKSGVETVTFQFGRGGWPYDLTEDGVALEYQGLFIGDDLGYGLAKAVFDRLAKAWELPRGHRPIPTVIKNYRILQNEVEKYRNQWVNQSNNGPAPTWIIDWDSILNEKSKTINMWMDFLLCYHPTIFSIVYNMLGTNIEKFYPDFKDGRIKEILLIHDTSIDGDKNVVQYKPAEGRLVVRHHINMFGATMKLKKFIKRAIRDAKH